jgi:thiaminase/transcriptional activator TenA
MNTASDANDTPTESPQDSLALRLWEANSDLARAALGHPFVQGLAAGTLPRERFQHYIMQDAYYLEAFARAFAFALAHSPDREGMAVFFELLGGVQRELPLHNGYAKRWGIALDAVTPSSATLNYTDFLLARAALGDVGVTCAAMIPCMRLYAYLGQTLAAQGAGREENSYGEWVRTYASSESEALTERLEALLDRYARDTPAVRAAYRRAMQLEVAFFEAGFAGGS